MELLSQELKELMCVLLLVAGELLVGFPLRHPEASKHVVCRVSNGVRLCMEGLKHLIHCTCYAVLPGTLRIPMAVAQVEVSQQRVLHQTLQNDIHVARSPHVVDAAYSIGTTRRIVCVQRHKLGVFFRCICEKVIELSFPCCSPQVSTVPVTSGCTYMRNCQCQICVTSGPRALDQRQSHCTSDRKGNHFSTRRLGMSVPATRTRRAAPHTQSMLGLLAMLGPAS